MAISISVADLASINTFDDLVGIIPEYLDGRVGADQAPSFIRLAEGEINRRLALDPVRKQIARQPVTLNAEYLALPDLFLKEIALEIVDGNQRRYVSYVDPVSFGPSNPRERWCSPPSAAPRCPRIYTVLDDEIRLYPVPQTSHDASFIYYQRLPALTSSNQSNWFLDDNADVYLYGALAHANAFLPDQDKANYWGGLFDQRLSAVLEAYPRSPSMVALTVDSGLMTPCDEWSRWW